VVLVVFGSEAEVGVESLERGCRGMVPRETADGRRRRIRREAWSARIRRGRKGPPLRRLRLGRRGRALGLGWALWRTGRSIPSFFWGLRLVG
jgi:hypothetical protein